MVKTREWARALPPLPEIDGATRREFLIGSGSLLMLGAVGCGSGGGPGGNEAASDEIRTVKHALGTTEVPTGPQSES